MKKRRNKPTPYQKPHQRAVPFKLTPGVGEIEFRDKTQKSWPQATEDVFILTYKMMLGRHPQKIERSEHATYEEAWEEARQLGVILRNWPDWLQIQQTKKFSTRKGVVDLPFSGYEKRQLTPQDFNPNRFKKRGQHAGRS